MRKGQDREFLLSSQYKTGVNLNARIALHQRFSVNPQGFHRWLFEQMDFSPRARLLEVGCGSAAFWQANLDRIPAGWDVTLTDFSSGMLDAARAALAQADHPFHFDQADAQDLPFAHGYFDGVIANHMLYHIPDRPRALRQIARVLKPGAKFYAATNGPRHMVEIQDVLRRSGGDENWWRDMTDAPFSLDNGAAQLEPVFSHVEMRRYEDGLNITEPEPLVAYVESTSARLDGAARERLVAEIEGLIASQGSFHVSKETGVFIATA